MKRQYMVDEITEAVCSHLTKIAAKGKIPKANKHGVQVLYNKRELGEIIFRFVTQDDIECIYKVDIAKASREYFEYTFKVLIDGIQEYRRKRQDALAPSIILPEIIPVIIPGT